mmetsp:Transcript_8892/g.33574  ORF Transcript_8892/g.33574 Transcript_8892/m.33574 type:complete len:286 (+) Transcript_8892:4186-5043(+)
MAATLLLGKSLPGPWAASCCLEFKYLRRSIRDLASTHTRGGLDGCIWPRVAYATSKRCSKRPTNRVPRVTCSMRSHHCGVCHPASHSGGCACSLRCSRNPPRERVSKVCSISSGLWSNLNDRDIIISCFLPGCLSMSVCATRRSFTVKSSSMLRQCQYSLCSKGTKASVKRSPAARRCRWARDRALGRALGALCFRGFCVLFSTCRAGRSFRAMRRCARVRVASNESTSTIIGSAMDMISARSSRLRDSQNSQTFSLHVGPEGESRFLRFLCVRISAHLLATQYS